MFSGRKRERGPFKKRAQQGESPEGEACPEAGVILCQSTKRPGHREVRLAIQLGGKPGRALNAIIRTSGFTWLAVGK